MMNVRLLVTQKMLNMMLLLVILLLCPVTIAESTFGESTLGESTATEVNERCNTECGCEGCLALYEKFMKRILYTYDKNNEDILSKEGMAKSIYIEGEKIFKGIMISVIFFMACAGVCVVSACIYCCRINYTDRKLKSDVKALAKKVHRDYNSKKAPKRSPLPAVSESCNVVVEDAGVFVC